MVFTILLPHYKTGKMTAYAISQLLKYRGKHEISIIVIDNSFPDDSIKHLTDTSLADYVTILPHAQGGMQSHGIAFDEAMSLVDTPYFITVESDSFPTHDNWLDEYEKVIELGGDAAGSILTLSGGNFLHPAGALYCKNCWKEAWDYVQSIPYTYFPNMGRREDFSCHLMVRDDLVSEVVVNSSVYNIELDNTYIGKSPEEIKKMASDYSPIGKGVFHNGMGQTQERLSTYRFRNIKTEPYNILVDSKEPIIYRMGFEPGQWFCYWMMAMKKSVYCIPTEMVWMPRRENQQQDYTLMENGFKHLWGVTAYAGVTMPERQDIIDRKNQQLEALYSSLPPHQKL